MIFVNKKNKIAHSFSCAFSCVCNYIFFKRMWEGNDVIIFTNTFYFFEDFFHSFVFDSCDYSFPSMINKIPTERIRELRGHLKFKFYRYFVIAIVIHLLASQYLDYTSPDYLRLSILFILDNFQ